MIVAELFATLGLIPEEKSWKAGEELIEGVHHLVEEYLSYEALKGVVEMFTEVAEAASHAANQASRLGETVEALGENAYIEKLTDLGAGELDRTMRSLDKTLEHLAKTGKGPALEALHKLHISLSEFKALNTEQRLAVLADRFKALPDGAEKSAIALKLHVQNLIPALNKGSEGIEDLRAEARKLGVVMDSEVASRFGDLTDNWTRLSEGFRGFKEKVAEALLPIITQLTDKFLDWFLANRDWIESGIEKALEVAIGLFKSMAVVIADGIEFLKKHKEYLLAMGLVLAGVILPATISWAIASIAAIAPWLALGAAVAVVAYWIRSLVEDSNEGFSITEAWDDATNSAGGFSEWLEHFPEHVRDWVGEAANTIKEKMAEAWKEVSGAAQAAWAAIEQIPIIGRVIRAIEWLANHDLKDLQSERSATRAAVRDADEASKHWEEVKARGEKIEAEARRLGAGLDARAQQSAPIQTGDVHITVQGSNLTPEQVRDTVADHVREAQTDAVRQAMASLGGGKRQ